MADINKEASWVTARLLELGTATGDGANTLITNSNIATYTAGKENVSKITIGSTEYTVRTSTADAGAAGYITFVLEA